VGQTRATNVVLYALDVDALATFYQSVCGLQQTRVSDSILTIHNVEWEISLVTIPGFIAADIVIEIPPQRREDTPIKLVFSVDSIQRARGAAAGLGGVVDPEDREWSHDGYRYVDGHDPEGNVFSLAVPN